MAKSNHQGPPPVSAVLPPELPEEVEAAAVDAKVDEILRLARERPSDAPLATEESIRAGAEYMRQVRQDAMTTLLARIERKDFVPRDELRELLGVNDEWITDALADNRLFFVLGPSEVHYFPSFYADAIFDREALESVCHKLGDLSGASKYFFFTSKSTFLRTRTPLEALSAGMLTEVLIAAEGFAER